MIQNFDCPICKNNDMIIIQPSFAQGHGSYTIVQTSAFGGVEAVRCVCKKCGYLMEFFKQEDIPKIAKRHEGDKR